MSNTSKNEKKMKPEAEPMPEAQGPDGCEASEDLSRILEARLTEAENRAAELQAENAELKDQYLRKLADYENFRKRMFRDKDDAVQFANSSLIQDLLGILDDFDRAISSSEVSRDFQVFHDGIGMVRNRLLATLEGKYGLSRFDAAGAVFDPNIHEAVAVEKAGIPDPVVSEEFVKGYKLHGRVLRAAKVKVRMPDGTASEPGPGTEAAGPADEKAEAGKPAHN